MKCGSISTSDMMKYEIITPLCTGNKW